MCRMLRFKDDPRTGDQDYLRLTLEAVPAWLRGRSMRTPQPVGSAVVGSE
jgi:hypothetical protein